MNEFVSGTAAKFPQPSFKWQECEPFDGAVNGCQESQGRIRIVFVNVSKIAEGIQFGVMPDKNFNPLHAAMA